MGGAEEAVMMINRRNWNSGILTLNTQSRYCNNPLNKNFRFYGQTVGDVGPNKNRILGAKLAKLRHAPMKRDRISRVLDQKPVLARTEKQFPRCLRRHYARAPWRRGDEPDRFAALIEVALKATRRSTARVSSLSRSAGRQAPGSTEPTFRRPGAHQDNFSEGRIVYGGRVDGWG